MKKKRTGATRVRQVEAKRPRDRELVVTIRGTPGDTADPDILAFLDGLLAEGRALMRSRGRA